MGVSGPLLVTRFGAGHVARLVAAVAAIGRHTSRDTLLLASIRTRPSTLGREPHDRLTEDDVDGLSRVIDGMNGHHLDLVLHGTEGGLTAAGELTSMLRGRYESIRALVPSSALSIMSLIALTCDTVVMPDTALLGAAGGPANPAIDPADAAEWVARHCCGSGVSRRIELTSMLFSGEDGLHAPVTAAHARDLGLAISLVGERSGIGADLRTLGDSLEQTARSGRFIRLITNHRGVTYVVND